MSFEDWILVLIGTGFLGSIGGYFLKASIEKSVSHMFDRELEKLKADLKRKDTEINDLRAGALSGLSARHAELDRCRIRAASNLWSATVRERQFQVAAGMVSRLNLPEIRKFSEQNQNEKNKMMQLGEVLWTTSGIGNLPPRESAHDNDRIFLPPQAWLCFDALRMVGANALAVLAAIRAGAPLSLLKDSSEINEKIKKALPHQSELLSRYPDTGPYFLIGELEDRIFADLVNSLNANESHLRMVEDASRIVTHAKLVMPGDLPAAVPDELRIDPPSLDAVAPSPSQSSATPSLG
ncbi:hypothetical protein [Rhizobium leguminosarum]|uniref:hypothetical protein n=1 Tax=Rhizobium leguminosarum TaxID=384 RepID=UPI00036C2E11|nr:hypothetical protein [Rhizobium leguminosarum]